MSKLKVFSGCTEFGSEVQAFRDRGHDVTTLGLEGNVTICQDIRDFHTNEHYDFMTFHPPCTCFSIAAVRHHWTNGTPNPETIEAMTVVKACIRIIREANPTYWMIENPRGMLRKVDFMKELTKKYFRSTITYCQYGYTSQKPTDLWHNIPTFHPKWCHPNSSCHVSSPRSSTPKGTVQSKSKKQRSIVPYQLSLEVCRSVEGGIMSHANNWCGL